MPHSRVDVMDSLESVGQRDAEPLVSYSSATEQERLAVEDLMRKVDSNNDGRFSPDEVRTVCVNLLRTKRKVRNLTRTLVVGAVVAVAVCGVLLGLMFVANEATKEVEAASDGTMRDTSGNPLKVERKLYEESLVTFREADLPSMKELALGDEERGRMLRLHVLGYETGLDTKATTLHMTAGYAVEVTTPDGATDYGEARWTLVRPDGSSYVFADFSSSAAQGRQLNRVVASWVR